MPVVQKSALGGLTPLSEGEGGQGRVYLANNLPDHAVKLYGPRQRVAGNILLELTEWRSKLPSDEQSFLDSVSAWPLARVDDGKTPVGVTMKLIPRQFIRDLNTGLTRPLELKYLIRPERCRTLGIEVPSDEQRLTILRKYAEFLEFLHARERIYGDVSPSNWLWSAVPSADVFVIDCDATRKRGGPAAVPVLGTDGWMDPTVPSSAQDVQSDLLLFARVVVRVLAGEPRIDYEAGLDRRGPPFTPEIIELIRRAVQEDRSNRPSAKSWVRAFSTALNVPGPSSTRQRTTVRLRGNAPVSASPGGNRTTTRKYTTRPRGSINVTTNRPPTPPGPSMVPAAMVVAAALMIVLAWLASHVQ